MRACVLIPTYNESKAIGGLVADIKKEGFDILVVDDGSLDNTAAIAGENGAAVIAHEKNRGKGASLRSGFGYALEHNYDAVVVMDGDGQHNPRDIKRFIRSTIATQADLIIGDRMSNVKKMPLARQVTNKLMSLFISGLCGQTIPDTQCGFRLIKSGLLRNMRLISSKYETESEILIRAGRNNFRIASIPIDSVYNGEASMIHPLKDAYRFIRLIVRMALENNKKQKKALWTSGR